MFFRRPPQPEPEAPKADEPPPGSFLPPAQGAGQPDDDYRLVLIDLIAEIDRTKRDIKGQIHSHAITAKAERVSVDQVWLRRAKDKIDHLTREREEIRKALHVVNERIKEQRRAAHRPQDKPRPSLDAAFRRVARERLPGDLYADLMDEAAARSNADPEGSDPGP